MQQNQQKSIFPSPSPGERGSDVMTIVDLRQDFVFPPGAFVSVRTGLMLRMSQMLIDISRRQLVTIIRTRIAKQSGKDGDNQQQIWTYCTSCIVIWLIIDKVDCGVFLFCRV
jgi:hypothetical protein